MSPDAQNADRLLDDVVLERELRQALGPEREGLVDVLRIGQDMEQFLLQNPAAKKMAQWAFDQASAAALVLFGSSDITTQECQDAHFEGRLGMAMISVMNQMLVEGRAAEQMILATEFMASEQLPEGDG